MRQLGERRDGVPPAAVDTPGKLLMSSAIVSSPVAHSACAFFSSAARSLAGASSSATALRAASTHSTPSIIE